MQGGLEQLTSSSEPASSVRNTWVPEGEAVASLGDGSVHVMQASVRKEHLRPKICCGPQESKLYSICSTSLVATVPWGCCRTWRRSWASVRCRPSFCSGRGTR